MSWDGIGCDVMGWDGTGWDRMGRDGMGWDAVGCVGMEWDAAWCNGVGWDWMLIHITPPSSKHPTQLRLIPPQPNPEHSPTLPHTMLRHTIQPHSTPFPLITGSPQLASPPAQGSPSFSAASAHPLQKTPLQGAAVVLQTLLKGLVQLVLLSILGWAARAVARRVGVARVGAAREGVVWSVVAWEGVV